ncbi:MAG TPA: glycoside hydrolase family 3 N-terminal domain-containing protein [Longimicrobiales bacterium]
MLLALASSALVPARPVAAQLYRDSTRPLNARVEDLLRRMTLEEKVAQMECMSPRDMDSVFAGGAADRYGPAGARWGIGHVCGLGFAARGGPRQHAEVANRLQRYFVEHGRLGIPVILTEEALHGLAATGATNYPTPLAMASSFDPELVHQVFAEVGAEAAAAGTNHVLSPVLDLAQDPRWGRTEETYGEDPYLVSRMGVAAITGYQGGRGPRIDRQHVAATTKHFAGHGVPEGGRNIGPPHMSEHELRDMHLRPFEAAVREAGVAAVMPAYHELLGIPVHASPFMLTRILRDEWGFQGEVVSDFYGVRYLVDTHFTAGDSAEAAREAATAGVDVDMPELASYRNMVALVRAGRVPQAVIDRSVRRVLRAKFALGLFDHPYVDAAVADSIVSSRAHLATARRIAGESIVLLRNEGGLLPLDPARVHTIALIGPHADYAERGNYAGVPASVVTPLAALRARLGAERVLHAEGVRLLKRPAFAAGGPGAPGGPPGAPSAANQATPAAPAPGAPPAAGPRRGPATPGGGPATGIPAGFGRVTLTDDSTNERLIQEAVAVARQADVVVLALGETAQMQREAWKGREGDNASLELRAMQNELVDAVKQTGKPVIVLLFSGGPLAFGHIDRTASAILYCWYLGQETGDAVADVLLGTADASGRLPITIPRSTGQLPVYYDHKPSARRQDYEFDESAPLYPFGFGLSYTSFTIGNVRLERSAIARTDSVRVFADVSNTGSREGTAVVQLYLRQDFTIPTRPVKELADFRRVTLVPGQTRTVEMLLTPAKLGHIGADMRFVVEPGPFKVMVGSSSRDQDLSTLRLDVR